jgi:hypothetical protein
MKHDVDESSFGICAQNIPSSDATPRGGNHESNASGDASAPFATLDQTVSALKGDVPGGSLERLGKPSRYLSVVWNTSMSEPRHPLRETSLVIEVCRFGLVEDRSSMITR